MRGTLGSLPLLNTPLTGAASAPHLVMRKWTYRSRLSARFGPVFRLIRPNRYVELLTVDDGAAAGHGGWGGENSAAISGPRRVCRRPADAVRRRRVALLRPPRERFWGTAPGQRNFPRERSPHASRPGVDLEPSRITVLWPTHGDDADTPVWTAESEPLDVPRQPLQRAAQPTGSPTG